MKHPGEMSDEEYDEWIGSLPIEEAVTAALRESRFVGGRFPPYASGAGDVIEHLLRDLKRAWYIQLTPDRDRLLSCPCGRGDYDLCMNCFHSTCSVHGDAWKR